MSILLENFLKKWNIFPILFILFSICHIKSITIERSERVSRSKKWPFPKYYQYKNFSVLPGESRIVHSFSRASFYFKIDINREPNINSTTYRIQFLQNFMIIKNDSQYCGNHQSGVKRRFSRFKKLCCDVVDDRELDHCTLKKEYEFNREITDNFYETEMDYRYVQYKDQIFSYDNFFGNIGRLFSRFPNYASNPPINLYGRDFINYIIVIKNPSTSESIKINEINIQENEKRRRQYLGFLTTGDGISVYFFFFLFFIIFPLCICFCCCNICFCFIFPVRREGKKLDKNLCCCCFWLLNIEAFYDLFHWFMDRFTCNTCICDYCFCLLGPVFFTYRVFHQCRLFLHYFLFNHFCCSCSCFLFYHLYYTKRRVHDKKKFRYYFGEIRTFSFLCRKCVVLSVFVVVVFLVQTFILEYYVQAVVPQNYCGMYSRCVEYKSKDESINENQDDLYIVGRNDGDETIKFEKGEAFLLQRESISSYSIFGLYPSPYNQCMGSRHSFLSCQIDGPKIGDSRPICTNSNENLDLWFNNKGCSILGIIIGSLWMKLAVLLLTRIIVIPLMRTFGCLLMRWECKKRNFRSYCCSTCLCCTFCVIVMIVLIMIILNIFQFIALGFNSWQEVFQFFFVLVFMTFLKDFVEVPLKFFLTLHWRFVEEFKNSGYEGENVTEEELTEQKRKWKLKRWNKFKKKIRERFDIISSASDSINSLDLVDGKDIHVSENEGDSSSNDETSLDYEEQEEEEEKGENVEIFI